MLVVLTEIYCNKVNIQITQRDDFIQIAGYVLPDIEYMLVKTINIVYFHYISFCIT